MAEQETTDVESDDDESFNYFLQVKQSPHTIIEGDIVDIVTGADIDGGVESTGTDFGVVFEDPTVEKGELWQNGDIPEGFDTTSEYNDTVRLAIEGTDNDYVRGMEVTEERVEEARERLADTNIDFEEDTYDTHRVKGVDYKVSDRTDKDTKVTSVTIEGEEHVTGMSLDGNAFEGSEVDEFDSDRIMVWYGGMSGQFVSRALDFNGMPFARYTDEGYLVKGLFQVPIGWRGEADVEQYDEVPTTDRKKLSTDLGRPPRVARPPVLRDDLGESRTFVAIGRYMGGDQYEAEVGLEAEDYTDFMSEFRKDIQPHEKDYDVTMVDMKYDDDADAVLSANFDNPNAVYAMYHGEGWQNQPESVATSSASDTSGASFDVEVDDSDDATPSDAERQFAEMVSEKIEGTGVEPDAAFESKGGLAGLADANSENFDEGYDVDTIRELVYDNTSHLSTSDL